MPVKDLDTFLKAVAKISGPFQVKTISRNQHTQVKVMKTNEGYFPTVQYVRDPKEAVGWAKKR